MAVIERTREIKTKTRGSAGGFKVECQGIQPGDILKVTITHADFPDFIKKYIFQGSELVGKNSVSFKAVQTGSDVRISWQSGMTPRIDLS